MASDKELLAAALPRYEIGEEIGRGGWGVVLRGQHRDLGRDVAIKQLPRTFGADPVVRERFIDEARLVARLDHPHIVPLYDFVEHAGLLVIVMEFVAGGTLWDRFKAQGVGPQEAVAVVLAAAVALHRAHQLGVLHRDVKPENILFTASGVPKLADFGIAKSLEESAAARTATGSVIGTPAYMAPEQVSGDDLSPLTDVYSLAIVLYELLTGQLPYRPVSQAVAQMFQHVNDTPRPMDEVRPGIHPALEAVARRALEKNPADRYDSAEDFAVDLAVAGTAAFGPGWLGQGGYSVMSATKVVAATERPPPAELSGTAVPIPEATRPVRAATARHPRLGGVARTPPTTATDRAQPPTDHQTLLVPGAPTTEPQPELPPEPEREGDAGSDGDGDGRRNRMRRAVLAGGSGLVAILAVVVASLMLADGDSPGSGGTTTEPTDATTTEPTSEAPVPSFEVTELRAGRRFPTAAFPDGIDIDHFDRIWVAATAGDQVLRIDPDSGSTDAVSITGDHPDGPDPLALAVTDDGAVWVSLRNEAKIIRLDSETMAITDEVEVGDLPHAFTVDLGSLWVSTASHVARVDPVARTVIGRLDVATPAGVGISDPGGDGRVWVVSREAGEVVEFDGSTNEPTGRSVAVGQGPDSIVVDAVEGSLWVTNRGEGTVVKYDPWSEETTVIPIGSNPADIIADGERIWLSDNGEGKLVLIDALQASVIHEFPVGPAPLDLAVLDGSVVVSVTGENVVQWVWALTEEFSQPFANITGVREESGRFVIDYEPIGYEPNKDGNPDQLHTHFFWNTTPAVGAGVGGPGDRSWLVWDVPLTVSDPYFDTAQRPEGATAVCALVADSQHRVADLDGDGSPDPESGNCAPLPG